MRNADRDRPVPPAADQGGDPVCWAHLVCPECGRFNSPDEADEVRRCTECGAELS